jgi:hypothetical protein
MCLIHKIGYDTSHKLSSKTNIALNEFYLLKWDNYDNSFNLYYDNILK